MWYRLASYNNLPEHEKPYEFDYLHNNEKAPNFNELFGQHLEPAGYYMIENTHSITPENYESGKHENIIQSLRESNFFHCIFQCLLDKYDL